MRPKDSPRRPSSGLSSPLVTLRPVLPDVEDSTYDPDRHRDRRDGRPAGPVD